MEEEEEPRPTRTLLFGDDYSNLLDQYERTLFLIDLDKAILSCRLSENANSFPYDEFDYKDPQILKAAAAGEVEEGKEHGVLSIHKALKKLARPVIFKYKKKVRICHMQKEGDKVRFECRPFSRSLGY